MEPYDLVRITYIPHNLRPKMRCRFQKTIWNRLETKVEPWLTIRNNEGNI